MDSIRNSCDVYFENLHCIFFLGFFGLLRFLIFLIGFLGFLGLVRFLGFPGLRFGFVIVGVVVFVVIVII